MKQKGGLRETGALPSVSIVAVREVFCYNPIFDSKRAEMPLFLGIIRSFDLAKM